MNKNKNTAGVVVLALLIFITFYYLLRNNELGKLVDTIGDANPVYLVVGLLFMFIFVASEGLGIQVLLDSLNYKRSFMKCLKYSFLGFYYCSITPSSGGQPVQVYYMNKDGIEVGAASLCIMIITISYQIGILLICLSALILEHTLVSQNLGVIKYFAIFGTAINFLMALLVASTTFHNKFLEKIISLAIGLLAKIKIIKDPDGASEKVFAQLDEYRTGAEYVKKNPKVLFIALLTIVVQILSRLAVTYAVYKSFDLHGYNFLEIIALQAFLALGVEYLPIPGSVGAAEAGFMAVNSKIFGADKVMSAMLLSRGISFYAFLIISGTVAITVQVSLSRRSMKRVPDPKS